MRATHWRAIWFTATTAAVKAAAVKATAAKQIIQLKASKMIIVIKGTVTIRPPYHRHAYERP